jgi:hypothetical protein
VLLVALVVGAGAAVAGEPPGRVIPEGKTSRGGEFGLFFDTRTLLVEGLDLQWGCKSVAAGKPAYEILTHKGIGKIPASHKLSINTLLPYTKIGSSKVIGKARVALTAALAWGPETNSIRRATATGTVSVKTGPCSSGTLTFSARNH